jgi:hypothetical protein
MKHETIKETIFNDVLSKEDLKIVNNRLKQEIGYRLAIVIITDKNETKLYNKISNDPQYWKAINETSKQMRGRQ